MKKFNITVNGKTYEVDVEEIGGVSHLQQHQDQQLLQQHQNQQLLQHKTSSSCNGTKTSSSCSSTKSSACRRQYSDFTDAWNNFRHQSQRRRYRIERPSIDHIRSDENGK